MMIELVRMERDVEFSMEQVVVLASTTGSSSAKKVGYPGYTASMSLRAGTNWLFDGHKRRFTRPVFIISSRANEITTNSFLFSLLRFEENVALI